MYFNPAEFALLSRGGRVPAALHPRVRPEGVERRSAGRCGPPLRSRLRGLVVARRTPVAHGPPTRIDIHEYLELEFAVDERR